MLSLHKRFKDSRLLVIQKLEALSGELTGGGVAAEDAAFVVEGLIDQIKKELNPTSATS